MNTLFQDLRYALRILAREPTYTAVILITVAIGVGANTAIFSVLNSVLLTRLPYEHPDGIVMVWEHNRPRARLTNVVNPANFMDWRDQNSVFAQMAAFYDNPLSLTGVGDPEEIHAQRVTSNFFSLLGAEAAWGRTFMPDEGMPGREQVVVISHGLWQRRFGADQAIVGRTLMLSGNPCNVIGIMPPQFEFYVKEASFTGKRAEMWFPLVLTEQQRVRSGRFLSVVARLKPGVTPEQAQSAMTALAARLEEQFPQFNTGWGVNVVPLLDQKVANIRLALYVLMGAVALVLLIAAANVSNLMMARGTARRREFAVRAALGAGRGRVLRQLLTEGLLLAVAGGAAGLVLGTWSVSVLVSLAPRELLDVHLRDITLDPAVLGFALGISLLAGILFGSAPAIEMARTDVNAALKEGARSEIGGGRAGRLRGAFVISEVVLALVLLTGASLLMRSFLRLQAVDPGFRSENLLTLDISLPRSSYREDQRRVEFFRAFLARIRTLPGVVSASAISSLPLGGLGAATDFRIVGRPAPAAGQESVADVRVVDPDYFRTMGIPFRSGRGFSELEAVEAKHVVIINEYTARIYWPDEDPIGKQVDIDMFQESRPSEIIGVVGDVRHYGFDVEPRPMTYWPHPELVYGGMTVVVRSTGDPLILVPLIRSELRTLDKDLPISDIRPMDALVAESLARSRFNALLIGLLSGIAVVLAAVGIAGVMSYTVRQRTQEIGLRLALGASRRAVVRDVVGMGMRLALPGVAIGLGASLALTRLLERLLYQVSIHDPVSIGGMAVALCLVALIACWIPARRATAVDPMVALRYE